LKDSCLVNVIGVPELLNVAIGIGKSRSTVAEMMVAAAVIYLILSLLCYIFGQWVERRMKVRGGPELNLKQAHGH